MQRGGLVLMIRTIITTLLYILSAILNIIGLIGVIANSEYILRVLKNTNVFYTYADLFMPYIIAILIGTVIHIFTYAVIDEN